MVAALPFEIRRVRVSKIKNTFSFLRDRLTIEKTALHRVDPGKTCPGYCSVVTSFQSVARRWVSS